MNWSHVGRQDPPITKVGETSWEVVIGLEVHARVISLRKLFSGAPATLLDADNDQNRQVTFYDAALPGTLPVLNKECLLQAIRASRALSGTIHKEFFFERKHYFYPDLPSGYQISQLVKPIAVDGHLTISGKEHKTVSITIERIQMEQDAGKSLHDYLPDKTCIDLNRSGVCLLEIVSSPEMHTVQEAQSYFKILRSLLRYVGVCDGNMEQGSMRADVNISLRRPGDDTPGIRCEIKNINSIRFMGQALRYEIQRQANLLEKGECVQQETRSFNPSQGKTIIMRTKEDARDYRYFKDPDLPLFQITDALIEEACASLPELQEERKKRLIKNYLIEEETARLLCEEKERVGFFEEACQYVPSSCTTILARWIVGDVLSLCEGRTITQTQLSPKNLANMITLLHKETLSGRMAKSFLPMMLNQGKEVQTLMEETGVSQITDSQKLEDVIKGVIKEHPKKALEVKNRPALHGWFVGQVMQKTKGQAHPQMTADLLKTLLKI